MQRAFSVLIFLVILTGGCAGSQREGTAPAPRPTSAAVDQETSDEEGSSDEVQLHRPDDVFGPEKLAELKQDGKALTTDQVDLFTGSGNCSLCHEEMTDQAGQDVSIANSWRGTMKAHAAVDPYFLAAVRREIDDLPGQREFIEDKCANCHMPIAFQTTAVSGEKAAIFGQGFNDPDHYLHSLASEGVSCTVCHQIQPGNLGEKSSFSGHFLVDTQRPAGSRFIYGPFSVTDRRAAVMSGPSGFIPQQAKHIRRSALCATCHTLFTPSINSQGEVVGEFPEQTPYLEWLESDYASQKACQDCHMPPAEGGVVLASTGGEPRSPFAQHNFVGANVYMLRVLRRFGEELGVNASSDIFEEKIDTTREQLERDAARVTLEELSWSGDTLQAAVKVENLAGHKLPSAFPSRRVWIRFTVTDPDGRVIFQSGDFGADGKILENDNDVDPAAYERHYEEITSSEQVQIYEPILINDRGEVTTHLLRVSRYVKDNRLLPVGFSNQEAPEEIQVKGQASSDDTFQGGGDRVTYQVDIGEVSGPLTVDAQILMQTVSYRWAENHRGEGTEESDRLMRYYDATPNLPVILARETAVVDVDQ